MDIIRNIKTETANKILNSSFLFFIVFVNLIKFLTRDSIKGNLNKACGDISFQSLDLFKFKFYSITQSIFPEIYSEFDQLESVCFGIISKQDNLFDFTSFYFVGSNYLFMPFIIFFIFSTVLFLFKLETLLERASVKMVNSIESELKSRKTTVLNSGRELATVPKTKKR